MPYSAALTTVRIGASFSPPPRAHPARSQWPEVPYALIIVRHMLGKTRGSLQMRHKLRCSLIGHKGLVAAISIMSLSDNALAQPSSNPFNQAEVIAGYASYHGYCAGCHGDQLQGGGVQGGDAPPLTGAIFVHDWSKYTIRVLYQFISKTMPDGLAGDLSAKTYSNIISFVLAANGAKPGRETFDPNSSTKIGDIADGRIVAAVTDAPIDAQARASQ